jgi:prepilin-type N-terminal cleavage/methylation domain-containing protein
MRRERMANPVTGCNQCAIATNRHSRPQTQTQNAFALIELLVCIGIIAGLAALSMPGLTAIVPGQITAADAAMALCG